MSKNVNGVLHTYLYCDNLLLQEKWGSSYIEYIYDQSGSIIEIKYFDGTNLNEYYFVKNLQGDVTQIRDWNGNLIARYVYDAWGKVLNIIDANGNAITDQNHIANINPIRYRGYYYDTETALYYLQSRYYDSSICRFISPDGCYDNGKGILGHNMFAYCGNNPVVRVDPDGESWILLGIIVAVGAFLFIDSTPTYEYAPAPYPIPTPTPSPAPSNPVIEAYSTYGNGKGNVYIVSENEVSDVKKSRKIMTLLLLIKEQILILICKYCNRIK